MKQDDVARLLAIEEIHQLKARYCRLVDTKQWAALREVFTDDARVISAVDWKDIGDFIGHLEQDLGDSRTVHHGHMPEMTFTGPDSARVIWAMYDRIEWSESARSRFGMRGIVGYGHYEEEYRRVDGRWKIAFLRLTRLWVDELPGDPPPTLPETNLHSPDWLRASA